MVMVSALPPPPPLNKRRNKIIFQTHLEETLIRKGGQIQGSCGWKHFPALFQPLPGVNVGLQHSLVVQHVPHRL